MYVLGTEGRRDHAEEFRSRKKTRNPEKHKKFIQKQKVQRGEEHLTKSGRTVKGKTFKAQLNCVCTRECALKIDVLRQKEIFDEYYEMSNWNEKTTFLRSLAEKISVEMDLNPIISLKKRCSTSKFFLTGSDGNRKQVCLEFLCEVLQITRQKMFRSLASNGLDRRGKFQPESQITATLNSQKRS